MANIFCSKVSNNMTFIRLIQKSNTSQGRKSFTDAVRNLKYRKVKHFMAVFRNLWIGNVKKLVQRIGD